jgi:hypothetical protein
VRSQSGETDVPEGFALDAWALIALRGRAARARGALISRNDATAVPSSVETPGLFRWATHLNAPADMLKDVDIAFLTFELARLVQV